MSMETTTTNTELPVTEEVIAEQIGISASKLRTLRQTRVLVNSWKKHGRTIFYWPSLVSKELRENG